MWAEGRAWGRGGRLASEIAVQHLRLRVTSAVDGQLRLVFGESRLGAIWNLNGEACLGLGMEGCVWNLGGRSCGLGTMPGTGEPFQAGLGYVSLGSSGL